MLTEIKRKKYLFFVAISMNLILFLIARFFNLPLWLDTTGTIYISLLLNFPAGLLVGLLNNAILSLAFYEFNSIFYYLISISVALISNSLYRKWRKFNFSFIFLLSISLFLVSIVLAIPLTIIIDGGIPSDYWGAYLHNHFASHNLSNLTLTLLSVSIIKFFDTIVTVTIVVFAFHLTPQKIRDSRDVVKINYQRVEQ